ncbi:unnamed protein product [Cuscuta epithymum]|uniref:Transposase n=1 Tax=Cuscuta epithymum TaxID=186058 RepID=A0AAV0CLQ8_9ASTE|nr:unnamed protein product [Cuscuta epithymum]CAH9148880.1 unnamed protein product [Cuscuta epithymum]
MKKKFKSRASEWLSKNIGRARRDNKKPDWIGEGDWKLLQEYWASDAFKKKSHAGKKNRNSKAGKESQYHGGRIPVTTHVERLTKELTRAPLKIEVFEKVYVPKSGDPPTRVVETKIRFILSSNRSTITQRMVGESQKWKEGANHKTKRENPDFGLYSVEYYLYSIVYKVETSNRIGSEDKGTCWEDFGHDSVSILDRVDQHTRYSMPLSLNPKSVEYGSNITFYTYSTEYEHILDRVRL